MVPPVAYRIGRSTRQSINHAGSLATTGTSRTRASTGACRSERKYSALWILNKSAREDLAAAV